MTHPESPVEQLTVDECWRFLASHTVGRLALVIAGEPDIFPVNYVVDGPAIVFRTGEGSKLLAVTVGRRMAFQADTWDDRGGTSVLAHGVPRELEGDERDAAERLGIAPWVPTRKTHWIRLEVDDIAGRRFTFGPEPAGDHPVG